LKTIFPEAFTEEKVDFEVLKQLLGGAVEEREEKYGLNWHGKRRSRQLALTPSTGTLRPCPAESVDWDTTRNLMIEGDNLEVLKLLRIVLWQSSSSTSIRPTTPAGLRLPGRLPRQHQELPRTHRPDGQRRPQDQFQYRSLGRFHTDWLNMMYPRLKLARNLLADDGLVFVNIDDGEAASLKLLMQMSSAREFHRCYSLGEEVYAKQQSRLFYSLKDTLIVFRKSDTLNMLREPRTEESKIYIPIRIRMLEVIGQVLPT